MSGDKTIDTTEQILSKAIRIGGSLAFLILGIATIFFFYGESYNHNTINDSKFSSFGTFVGALVSIVLNAITIYILYYTFKTQREDLKDTKEELVLSREINKSQSQILSLQQFENTFFKLMENHVKLIQSYDGNFPGYELLNNDFITLNKRLNDRIISTINHKFENIRTATYSHTKEPIFHQEFILKVVSDTSTIIDFIESKKESNLDFTFYHTLFYNLLRDSELYFFSVYSNTINLEFSEKYKNIFKGTYTNSIMAFSPKFKEYSKIKAPDIKIRLNYPFSRNTNNVEVSYLHFHTQKLLLTIDNKDSSYELLIVGAMLTLGNNGRGTKTESFKNRFTESISLELNEAVDQLIYSNKLIPTLQADSSDKRIPMIRNTNKSVEFLMHFSLVLNGIEFEYSFKIAFTANENETYPMLFYLID